MILYIRFNITYKKDDTYKISKHITKFNKVFK